MKRYRGILLILGLAAGFALLPAFAQSFAGIGRIYRLERSSTYQSGCFPPCLCPRMESAPVRGVFRITHTGSSGGYATYTITDVNWRANLGSAVVIITGGGAYRVSGGANSQQQLSLDLRIADHPDEHYDSGLVPAENEFPRIDAEISLHGGTCLDTVLAVRSRPLPRLMSGSGELTTIP